MNCFRLARPLAALAIFGAAVGGAHAFAGNPPIRVAQGVEYMCGGKSQDEASFIRMVAPRWAANLHFTVSRAGPAPLPAEVDVVVRERYSGQPVMQASTNAPFMLARLDPGAYEVEATLAGISLRQPLVVLHGVAARAEFVWPSNVDFASAAEPRGARQQAAAQVD